MQKKLKKIIELEENKKFELAFESYHKLYKENKNDFEIWKYYYFFLWIVIENMPNDFIEKIEREAKLRNMFNDGKLKFNQLSEFNFIVGYTMSIFPYEFGNYKEFEKLSKELILKAREIEPNNEIYEMVLLGDSEQKDNVKYKEIILKVAPIVLEKHSEFGLLNRYFKQVLYRIEKKI